MSWIRQWLFFGGLPLQEAEPARLKEGGGPGLFTDGSHLRCLVGGATGQPPLAGPWPRPAPHVLFKGSASVLTPELSRDFPQSPRGYLEATRKKLKVRVNEVVKVCFDGL